MIGERLDDAALAEPAVRILAHALQFAPQRFQARNFAFDLGKLMRGDTVRRGARRFGMGREAQQLPDVAHRP